MPPSETSIVYVYGIVPADLPGQSMPAGLDDRPVTLERHDGLAALVSTLDGASYAPEAIETNSGDVDWVSPRAVAHDQVLTWASDRGAVAPLPMFSLFSGPEAVRTMLRDRSAQLAATLSRVGQGREYSLRVYRIDAELLPAMATLSPVLGEMAAAAASASPGQRYLLERKLEAARKGELRAVSQEIVESVVSALAAAAKGQVRSPIPRVAAADAAARGTMVLNAAFLIAPDQLQSFQTILTELVREHTEHGFRFDFTGPWPPYHFVTASGDDQ